MPPALRDFIGTVRTKMSHITCDTLLPSPFVPALPCPASAAPVGWHADAEGSEDEKVVRRLRVSEITPTPMEKVRPLQRCPLSGCAVNVGARLLFVMMLSDLRV